MNEAVFELQIIVEPLEGFLCLVVAYLGGRWCQTGRVRGRRGCGRICPGAAVAREPLRLRHIGVAEKAEKSATCEVMRRTRGESSTSCWTVAKT